MQSCAYLVRTCPVDALTPPRRQPSLPTREIRLSWLPVQLGTLQHDRIVGAHGEYSLKLHHLCHRCSRAPTFGVLSAEFQRSYQRCCSTLFTHNWLEGVSLRHFTNNSFRYILCPKNDTPLALCATLRRTSIDFDNFWQECYRESNHSNYDLIFSTSPK